MGGAGERDEAELAAAAAGLRYVCDGDPGIVRKRQGRGFTYVRADGSRVAGRAERERIESIAVPPAWTDVWICPDPDGHILATGRDAKGRKQYRYHPDWRAHRDAVKFDRMASFAGNLRHIRRTVDADLRRRGLPEEKVLALVVRLLDETLIRVGNAEYADANESYGLTTLRTEDVEVDGSAVLFDFVGKGGADREVALRDSRLANLVKRCAELGGYEVFAYVDDAGDVVDVGSSDVNDYLRDMAGEEFTSKDFRTWGGSVVAAEALLGLGPAATERDREKSVLEAIDGAAEVLGNTRAVARSAYVAPAVLDAYRDESLFDAWRAARRTRHLRRAERAVAKIVGG